jgi:purine-binding chemotaxis protein CheW
MKNQKEKIEQEKLVTFQLGSDMFAAEVFAVERVLRHTLPNSVPDVPDWIEGVIEYQGAVIPVIDMRRRMGLTAQEITPETRTLVFVTQDGRIGAVVDAVHEVAVVPKTAISPPPAMFRGLSSEFVRGIAKVRDQLVVVLDVDRVLTSADRIALDRAVQAPAPDGASARG